MNRHLHALLLASLLLLVSLAPAAAAPIPSLEGIPSVTLAPTGAEWDILGAWTGAWLNEMFIQLMKATATLCYFLEKVAAGITRFLTQEDMWTLLLDSTLGTLRRQMPGILRTLVFSSNGAGGLLYLALMLAGILMIVPQLGSARLVDPVQVIVWGLVLSTLFISASWGYDLVGLLEQMRGGAVQIVVDTAGEEQELDALIARPLLASPEELASYGFTLPSAFETTYFPALRTTETRELVFIDSTLLDWKMTFDVETPESQRVRREQAQTGLALAALTLIPGFVLLLFGYVFATLAAGALVLIVFFLVSLPLGFFEFGAQILTGIVRQYVYLWSVTLLAVVLPGILVAAGSLTYPEGGNPSPEQLMRFIPVLLVVGIATSYVAQMATRAMSGTFGMVSTSVRTAMAPLAYAGGLPTAGGIPGAGALTGLAGFAATVAAGGLTGGAGMALAAGAGSLLSGSKAGQAAGIAAVGLGGARSRVFARAARSEGLARVAGVSVVASEQHRARQSRSTPPANQGTSQDTHQSSRQAQPADPSGAPAQTAPRSPHPSEAWEPVEAGPLHLADPAHLDAAEAHYQAGQRRAARRSLVAAFGNRAVANQVLDHYDQQGGAGMHEVRQIVETTQQSVLDRAQ